MSDVIEYRVSWEMPDPMDCARIEARNGRGVWPRISEGAWDSLSWRPSENVTTSEDARDQYEQLKAWAESRDQPIRNVRIEKRTRPDADTGWDPA